MGHETNTDEQVWREQRNGVPVLREYPAGVNAASEVTLTEEVAAGAAVQKTSAELRFEGILEDEQAS